MAESSGLKTRGIHRAPFVMTFGPQILSKKVDDAAFRTYLLLDVLAGGKDFLWYGMTKLGKLRDVDARTLRRHLSDLKDAGWIEVEYREGQTNLITVKAPEDVFGRNELIGFYEGLQEALGTPDRNVRPPLTILSALPGQKCPPKVEEGKERKEGEAEASGTPSEIPPEVEIPGSDPGPTSGRWYDQGDGVPLGTLRATKGDIWTLAKAWGKMLSARFPSVPVGKPTGQDYGKLKGVLKDFGFEDALAALKVVVLDWLPFKSLFNVREEYPTIYWLHLKRQQLVAAAKKGGLSTRTHRVSEFAKVEAKGGGYDGW